MAGDGECPSEPEAVQEEENTRAALNPDLIGDACSYSTWQMAERVVEQGEPWKFAGELIRTPTMLPSHVAAPFLAEDARVVATTTLERLLADGDPVQDLRLEGRMLEVSSVKYVVLTAVPEGD